ncbi:MAG: hypothetical protein FGM46_01015 [Ferruginibacter sp.]|nr:hypothetical protein [Ferruginibacter sp.]
MKKTVFFLLILSINTNAYSQVLISYGKSVVKKDEFLRAYNKNNTRVTDKEKSIRDYVELFTNFKLKVKAAEELRMDTSEQMKADIDGFRQQIEGGYLEDTASMKMLQDQAFERSQKDLHVLHFFTPVNEPASPKDTMNAFQLTKELLSRLKTANDKYDEIVPNPIIKYADLGYVTAFTLPYIYENIVYDLRDGDVSEPFRTRKGWHLFKVVDIRKNAGKWKVAQILFSIPPNADKKKISEVQSLADSVYSTLKKGEDFSSLAAEYSEDKLTFMNGGELAPFGTGVYDPVFEQQVFQLKKNNEITVPFFTSFGIHIVKRLDVTPTPSDKKEESFESFLKEKILQDTRVQLSKDKFAATVLLKTGLKIVKGIKETDLFRYADSVKSNLSAGTERFLISKKSIIQFKKESVKGEEWLNFINNYFSDPNHKNESNSFLWKKFQAMTAVEYYRKHLEEYSPEFVYQLQEFKEGNMLFEIMEKKVWGRATEDTAGLRKHYEANKEKYIWMSSADMIVVNATSEAAAKDAAERLKSGADWRGLLESRQGELQADSGRYELTQIEQGTSIKPVVGGISPVINNGDGTFTLYKYIKVYKGGEIRNFEDAKGMAINDYQVLLEKEWLAELRKKYPVKVNDAVLKTLLK